MRQKVDIVGRYNTVVQIAGDGNTVVSSHPHLELYLPPKLENPQGIELLDPKSRAIPFIGRTTELNALRAWLGSEKPVAVRVVTGGAGAGKTRLALHLCELAQADGWDAGFVDSGELVRFRTQQNLASWGWQRPTLIVIDYAALHAQQIHDWLRELGQRNRPDGKPLRLLLLERFAEPGQGWWQTAFGRGSFGSLPVQRMLDPPQPIPLSPLDANERRAVLDATLERAGSRVRVPKGAESAAFERHLEEMGEPLFLMMAGLRAADTGITSALSLNKTELALALADRELERIERTAQTHDVTPAMLVHLVAYATLCRGLGTQAAIDAAREEQAALGYDGASPPASLAEALVAALPGAEGSIAPILPDLIGEAAILRALADPSVDGKAAIERAFARSGQQVTATLIRAAQDFAGAGYDQPAIWLDALTERDPVAILTIAEAMPNQSVALAPLAAKLQTAITYVVRKLAETDAHLPLLASSLIRLGNRLSALGSREAALGSTEDAVKIWRKLAAANPDAYAPALAMGLNNLALSLSELGRREAALGAAEESVKIRRKLAAANPEAYEAALAESLNTLALRIGELDRHEGALGATEEAVKIRRKLAAANPEAYERALAESLNNLGKFLIELGRREAALGPTEEAVKIRRKLAAANPDAYNHVLADSLNNLGVVLSALGQREAALGAAGEAAGLYRKLAAANPDAYDPGLATALNNLAVRIGERGQREAALGPAEEAVNIRRKLAAANPHAYEPALAMALNNISKLLSELGRREAALGATEEAAGLYRKLAAANPDAYASDLAMSLHNLSVFLSAVGRREAALGPAEEAVGLRRRLAAANPDSDKSDLAMSLSNLGNRLGEFGRREAALDAAYEAVATLAPQFLALPAAYGSWMMTMVRNYLKRCEEVGREPDAELLGPIVEVLQRMQDGSDEGLLSRTERGHS